MKRIKSEVEALKHIAINLLGAINEIENTVDVVAREKGELINNLHILQKLPEKDFQKC